MQFLHQPPEMPGVARKHELRLANYRDTGVVIVDGKQIGRFWIINDRRKAADVADVGERRTLKAAKAFALAYYASTEV